MLYFCIYFESDIIGDLFSCFQWSLSNIALSRFHLRPLIGVKKAGIILKCLIIPCTLFFLILLRSDINQAFAIYSLNFVSWTHHSDIICLLAAVLGSTEF